MKECLNETMTYLDVITTLIIIKSSYYHVSCILLKLEGQINVNKESLLLCYCLRLNQIRS